jgi:hypothetical protein
MAAGDPGVLKRNFSATAIETTLVNSISSAATNDTTTSVSVVSVSGYPTVPFTLILAPDTNKEEVVTCTSVVGTTLQIVRGQDNTQAVSHTAGTSVRHGVSGRDFKEEQTHIAARGYDADTGILSNAGQTHVHGLVSGDGSVVGADQSVTLTRKTLTTPVINGATLTGTITSTASIVVSGAGTITGLSSASMTTSSATPKSYVDAILVLQQASAASSATSATMAATSAASAATSATSAATSATSAAASATTAAASVATIAASATSAANSATAAATSATSAAASATASASSASAAATSASSAATSATAAATSATSAGTSATAAATSATSAAASATAAGTSATSAAASATTAAASVATISAFATTASNSASAAATSATSAATSATSAAASATASASSASAAATSASSALTSQTAAATSATNAAASATAAATSATSAAASATAAATSATSAATSASSALTSQTAAATSAASAATSATSAATTYDDFDDRYLGSKSTAPTVDNDGNTLLVGAIYWNSTLNAMYVWSGSAWVQIANTTSYSAPTLGSTTISSGTTYSTITGLTLSGGLAAADPSVSLGLATKQYVDSVTVGMNFHTPVVAATTANLGVTYNNGSSGVGATLTADTLRAFNTLDGQAVSVGGRVLIKDQTNQIQNGIYTLTNNGAAGVTAWILTRATDNDNNPSGEMANGDIVNTTGGTINSGKTFVNSTTGTITIGTTNITYSAYYAGLPAQTGSNGLYLTTDGTTPSWSAVTTLSAPTITGTITASGDINLTAARGPGSLIDELTLLLMEAI